MLSLRSQLDPFLHYLLGCFQVCGFVGDCSCHLSVPRCSFLLSLKSFCIPAQLGIPLLGINCQVSKPCASCVCISIFYLCSLAFLNVKPGEYLTFTRNINWAMTFPWIENMVWQKQAFCTGHDSNQPLLFCRRGIWEDIFLGKLFIAFISGRSEVIHNSELLLLDTQIQSINFDFNITISIMPFREPLSFKTDLSFSIWEIT